MEIEKTRRRWLRIALLCGFVLAGACSLDESLYIFKLARISIALDELAPHLGDAEYPDEHQHALVMYPLTVVALGCAGGLYLTRQKSR